MMLVVLLLNPTELESCALASLSLIIIYFTLVSIAFILTFHCPGIEPNQPLEEHDVPYEVDQLVEEHDAPYQVSRITRSCSGLERGGSLA